MSLKKSYVSFCFQRQLAQHSIKKIKKRFCSFLFASFTEASISLPKHLNDFFLKLVFFKLLGIMGKLRIKLSISNMEWKTTHLMTYQIYPYQSYFFDKRDFYENRLLSFVIFPKFHFKNVIFWEWKVCLISTFKLKK